MQKCIPYHSLLLCIQVDTKGVKYFRSSSSAFTYNISHQEVDGKNVWGTRLEMLHTACQWKGETLSFPGCSCWYIYARLPIGLKVGQFGNMMFDIPGHCMGLLLSFVLPEAAKGT